MFKILYKKPNESSFQAISRFRYENKIQKIGHTGTLDPLAQGLLLVAIDEYTKLIPYIYNKDKEYKVICKLGYVSKTYDEEGPIEHISDYVPTNENINSVINTFIGQIEQIPPIYSAKKVNGKRSYELARKNKTIELQPIKVQIHSISKIKYKYPYLEFVVSVSNGTYIRSLINDIGQKLGTGAYITYLERTMVNGLRENDEINLQKLLNMNTINIDDNETLKKLFNGIKLSFNVKDASYLLEYKNTIIGIIVINNKSIYKINLFGKVIKNILEE
ncbi:MAG: tRNA pseudouridine(55) synthase TruB [Mycoplasma sp.]|nr:tRNA pseudouridine(55) synthase TruB [Mycoplasma sp.]